MEKWDIQSTKIVLPKYQPQIDEVEKLKSTYKKLDILICKKKSVKLYMDITILEVNTLYKVIDSR